MESRRWIYVLMFFTWTWGGVVVKALRYYSGGRGIDSRWRHWGFFPWYPRQNHVPWGPLSLWKWVPGISPGVKTAGALGWRPTTLIVPKHQEIRGLKLPGTPWATSACRGRPLLYFMFLTWPLCFLCKINRQIRNSTHTVKVIAVLLIRWEYFTACTNFACLLTASRVCLVASYGP